LAAETGVYRPSEHRAMAEAGHVRVPGGDFGGYIQSHVRRLEALRRAGIVERVDGDHWTIPGDYQARASDYDITQSRRMNLRVLSAYDLDRQVSHDGATWLDRELVSPDRTPLTQAGFGREVSQALAQRKEALAEMGYLTRQPDGSYRAPRDLIQQLEGQEIDRVGQALATERGRTWQPAQAGNYVSGQLIGSTQLASGRFAMIDGSRALLEISPSSVAECRPPSARRPKRPCACPTIKSASSWRRGAISARGSTIIGSTHCS
jgi:hypothetical protein